MKKGWKIFIWILVGVVVFVLGLDSGFRTRQAWEPQRALRSFLKFQEAWEDLYRQDKYGGQTPEETIDLFLDALKKGDLDLASKYFILDKQDEWRETLGEIQQEGNLETMIERIETAKGKWTEEHRSETRVVFTYSIEHKEERVEYFPDGKGGYQEVRLPAGQYAHDIILYKNQLSGVWKISMI